MVFRYGNELLELFIFIQILTTEPAEDTDRQDTQQGRRDGDAEQVEEFEMLAFKRYVTQHCHQ